MAAALRFYRIGEQSLWVDEVFTWSNALIGVPMKPADLLENLHGPLYAWLLHSWTAVAGSSEWALRFPSAVFGVALVGALAWLAGRWLGREAILPAAWLAAGSPFLVWYGQEARNYTLLMLCAVLATYALLRWSERPRGRDLLAYVALAWAGLLSNLSFALILPYHARLLALPLRGLRRRILVLVGAAAVLAVLVLPWGAQMGRTWAWYRLQPGLPAAALSDNLRGGPAFHIAALPFAWLSFSVGYTLGPSLRELRHSPSLATVLPHVPKLLVAVAAFGVLMVAGWIACGRRGRRWDIALWLVVPALLLSYLALRNFKPFNPRYLAVCVPAYLLLLAAGWNELRPRWRRGVGAAIAALWALALYQHYFVPEYGKEDFRSAAGMLKARGREGEVVVTAGAQEPLFYYYAGPLPVRRYWLGFASSPARMRDRFEQEIRGFEGVWVVLSRPEHFDRGGRFEAWLSRAYPAAERADFAGVRVWHLRGAARSSASPGHELSRGATPNPAIRKRGRGPSQ